MKQREIVDLKDIASKAGVSISTVSRVLKNNARISSETRKKVLEIASQCGYHENRLSRCIRTGKSGMVGVMLRYKCPFFGQVAEAIEAALVERDYLPVMLNQRDECKAFHRLVEQRVDGIIFVAMNDKADNDYLSDLFSCGMPVVSIDRQIPADVPFVGTDDEDGGRTGAEYLISLGHRKIGYYCGPKEASPAFLRFKGFSDVCREHGLPCTVLGTRDWYPDSDQTLNEQLRKNPDLTAIGCHSDFYAWQVIRLAEQNGRHVPDDLSVFGFGNLLNSDFDVPVVSSLNQKPEQLGRTAVDVLFRHIQNPSLPSETVLIKPELVFENNTVRRLQTGVQKRKKKGA